MLLQMTKNYKTIPLRIQLNLIGYYFMNVT